MDFNGFQWILMDFWWISMDFNRFLPDFINPARTWKFKETFPKHLPDASPTFRRRLAGASQTFPKRPPDVSQTFPRRFPNASNLEDRGEPSVWVVANHKSAPDALAPSSNLNFIFSDPPAGHGDKAGGLSSH